MSGRDGEDFGGTRPGQSDFVNAASQNVSTLSYRDG
jgi:hypothetical protein